MSLKSEIVVDKVSPLGGLFEVKGKLQIKKQDDDRPIFEIDPNTGTISNDGFILSNNDLDIPVFTFKDKNGFSILTDLTTETLSGRNNPNKGIKLHSNQSNLPITGPVNTITIGNIVDGLGSIIVNSDDQINYKGSGNNIRILSSDIIMKAKNGAPFTPNTGSIDFRVKETSNKNGKRTHTNVLIGSSRTARNQSYTGTHLGYDGSTSFLGSGSRTIVKNQFEVLQKTHFRGDVKIGVGSIDNFGAEAQTKFTHFTNFTSQLEETTTTSEAAFIDVFIDNDLTWGSGDSYFQTFFGNIDELGYSDDFSSQLQTLFDTDIANGGNGFDGLPAWAVTDTTELDEGALTQTYIGGDAVDKIAGTIQVAGESATSLQPTGPGELDPLSKGQLTILAGKSDGNPNGIDGWLNSASIGHYGSDLSASLADESFILHTDPSDANQGFVSNKDVGRDNQPAIKSKGSLTILIDTVNDPTDRFFEVISGVPGLEFHSNSDNKSLLVITPSDERTAVKHLSSSGDLFASTSLSTNESNASSHKIIVVDTASGKFFHKDADSLNSFLSLPDTPNSYSTEETVQLIGDNLVTIPATSFESHSLVVGLDGDGNESIQFIQAVHSASFALTASHVLGEVAGVGFPYAGSDDIAGDPAQAVITGSLFLSGSGHITASNISASNIIATSFTGSLSGSITNADTASFLDATASNATFAVTASYVGPNGIMSGSLHGNVTGSLHGNVTGNVTGSLHGTASWAYSASHAITASYILATNVIGDISSTSATTAVSGGSDSQPFHVVNDAEVMGDLTVSGSLGVAESITLADVTFSSSADAFIFGSGSDNTITHQMTGNLAVSASTGITLDVPANTAGFIGTSSWAMSASHAIFASESLTTISSSYILASGIDGDITAVNAVSASFVTGVMSGSVTGSFTGSMTGSLHGTASWAYSASNALTASYISASNIDGAIGFPFTGSASITGSLAVTNSISVQTAVANLVGVYATASHAESSSHALYASESISASFALTASYIASTAIDGQVGFPFTGSAAISGNLSVEGPGGSITASGDISASAFSSSITNAVGFLGTASYAANALNAETASYVLASSIEGDITATNAISASYVTGVMSGSITGSFTGSMTGSLLGTASVASFAESITDNTMLITQLKDVPDNNGAFSEANNNGYPSSHEHFILAVSGNNQEMEFVQTVNSASVAVSASTSITASHAITASFALNTTPSPTNFQALTDVSTTANSVDEDTSPLSYANIAWGPGNTIIYTTAHTGSFTGSFDGILTGSVHGTASHAESASHAATASYISASNIDGIINATDAISASYVSGIMTGSLHGTASWALSASQALFASESLTALSASYLSSFLDIDDVPDSFDSVGNYALIVNENNEEISFVQTVDSASVALTSSYALVAAGFADDFDGIITEAISASYVGPEGIMSGSLHGTASWAYSASNAINTINAISASYVSGIMSGSLHGTASVAISASIATTASYISASNIDGIIIATDATTAASGGSDTQPFHIVNDAFVSGNLIVCGSLGVAESVTLDDVVLEASSDAFIFGHNAVNTIIHQMTGNLELSASTGITANMSANTVGFHGTASHASSSEYAITASYIDLGDIDGTLTGFPYAGSDDLAGDPAQAVITGSLLLSGSGNITASNISASDIIAKSLQIDNAQSITALDSEGTAQDIAFISNGNITTFGDINLDTTILGDSITLDSVNSVKIDSDTGVVEFQDGGATSITFDTTNGAITASGGISASIFSSSLSSGIGFHGTASYAMTASLVVTASHALTASYIDVTDIEGTISSTNAISASYVTGVMSGSVTGSFTGSMTGSLLGTASWAYSASNALSASYVGPEGIMSGSLHGTASWAYSASIALSALTASFLLGDIASAISASYASSSSVAVNATTASYLESFKLIGDTPNSYAGHASHSVVVNTDGTGIQFTQTVDSASVAVFASQSHLAVTASYIDLEGIEGDLVTTFAALTDTSVPAGTADDPYPNGQIPITLNNTLIFTASVPLATTADTASHFEGTIANAESATEAISASYVGPEGIMSGSLHGTASWAYSASNALFASESLVAISASYFSGNLTGSLHGTASHALFASESIFAISASYVSGVMTGSLEGTASVAITASHALNSNPFPFEGFAVITGSLDLIGSITTQSNAIQNDLTDNTYVTSNINPNDGYPLFRMFNNEIGDTPSTTTSTLWFNNATSDIKVDYDIHGKLGIIPVIDRLGLMFNTETGFAGSYNRRIQISGSNDGGVTFTPLAQEAQPSTQPSRSFAFNNINPYKLYRFTFPSDQNFQLDTQQPAISLAIEEIFLYSDEGSVTANNFYGPLQGTASHAETASVANFTLSSSHAETASYMLASGIDGDITAVNAVSASFVTGVMSGSITGSFTGSMTGSLLGTASWAYSASNALFASESLFATNALSASYVSGVLTGSLYGTASWAISASQALTASYFSGSIDGDITGTASYATLASQSETVQVSLSSNEQDSPILFSLDTTPAGEFVGVYADPSMSYNAFTDTFNVPNISATNITASVVSASSFTGSLYGTASWAGTASHALNTIGGIGFPYAGSDTLGGDPAQAVITGSLFLSGSGNITASGHISASAITASSFLGTFTGSFSGSIKNADTASFLDGTASIATLAISGGSVAQPFHVVNDAFVSGTLFVSGNIATAESITIHDVTISQSAGAFTFGSGSDNTIIHQMTGNLELSASTGITANMPANTIGFHGTASHAINAITASYVLASDIEGTITATNAVSASFVTGVMSGSITGSFTGSMTGSLHGTASWAYSASNALFASESLVAISASYFSGNLTGSLHGTASHAVSASQALFASESLVAISASYVSGVLTGSLHGTASWAYSASNALFASESLSAISASYFSGNLTGSLYGTASWAYSASNAINAQTASFLEGFDPSSITTTYLDLTDTLDTDFTDKDEFVPVVDETNSKLVLKQIVPSASYAITASHAITSATSADTSTTSEFADTAGAINLGLATEGRHRIALTDLDGYGPEEKIFSPGIDQFVHDAQKGATGFNMGIEPPSTPESEFFPAQKLPHFSIETSNLIRIHGDLETQRPYTVLVDPINNAVNLPEPAVIGKKYGDVGIVLDGFARSIYSTTNIQDGINIDPAKTLNSDLVRMISYTSKGILAVGKSHQIHNGLNLHGGIGGDIRFYAELGQTDAPGGIEGGAGPIGMRVTKEIPRNANQGAVSIKGKLSVGNGPDGASSLSVPNDIQFIVHNPNNPTSTDANGGFDSPIADGGNSFGIKCESSFDYRGFITLDQAGIKLNWTTHPTVGQPYVIETTKRGINYAGGGVTDFSFIKDKAARFILDNKTGNISLPANHGVNDVEDEGLLDSLNDYDKFKSPYKLFIEGTKGIHSIVYGGTHQTEGGITSLQNTFNDNAQGSNFLDTGKALHVNNGISHFGGATVIGSPFRRATPNEVNVLVAQEETFGLGDGLGDFNVYGFVSSSTTGEPVYTVNSSSFNPNDYYGVTSQFTPNEAYGFFPNDNVIPLHSMGGEYFFNSQQYAYDETDVPYLAPGVELSYKKYDRSPASDPKLFVNGISYRAFENNKAITAIGVSSFEATEFHGYGDFPKPGTVANDKTALNVTGSFKVLGYSASFNARTFHLENAHFHNIYLDQGTFFHQNGDIDVANGDIDVQNGNIFVGSEQVQTESDRKLKQNIVDLDSQLDNIKALQPREYEWKKNNKKSKGFIAQELQEIYPSLVKEHKDTLHVGYTGLIPVLVKGMQEQQEMIEKLTSKINELEKKIDK